MQAKEVSRQDGPPARHPGFLTASLKPSVPGRVGDFSFSGTQGSRKTSDSRNKLRLHTAGCCKWRYLLYYFLEYVKSLTIGKKVCALTTKVTVIVLNQWVSEYDHL